MVTFPNGEVFMIPAEVVAKNRTEYYAEKDGFKSESSEWLEEFEQSMDTYELLDWMQNNMDWVDVKEHATKNESNEPDYDKMWFESSVSVLENG